MRLYRQCALVAVVVAVVAVAAAATASRLEGSAPELSLHRALALAEAHVAERHLDTSGQYLCGVTLRYDDRLPRNGHYWLVQWAWVMPRLGGELSLQVHMDGSVTGGPLGP